MLVNIMNWKISAALLTLLAAGYWAGYRIGHDDGEIIGYLRGSADRIISYPKGKK